MDGTTLWHNSYLEEREHSGSNVVDSETNCNATKNVTVASTSKRDGPAEASAMDLDVTRLNDDDEDEARNAGMDKTCVAAKSMDMTCVAPKSAEPFRATNKANLDLSMRSSHMDVTCMTAKSMDMTSCVASSNEDNEATLNVTCYDAGLDTTGMELTKCVAANYSQSVEAVPTDPVAPVSSSPVLPPVYAGIGSVGAATNRFTCNPNVTRYYDENSEVDGMELTRCAML
jgi:hypothetical protein